MSSRILSFAFATTTLTACGGSGSGTVDPTPDAPGITPPTNGFALTSPDVSIPAGGELTYCWYFKTSNTAEVDITKWTSHMTAGSHHLIVYLTSGPTAGKPIDSAPTACGGGGLQDVWSYSAQSPDVVMQIPTDDGAGKPLAMKIPAGQYGFIQMHYVNTGDVALNAHVEVTADGLATGTAFTPTSAFVTYVSSFQIPATATAGNEYTVTNTCQVPAGRKFWTMSTHAHKQAVETKVVDNTTAGRVFDSIDWEHPGAVVWNPAFYGFASTFTNSCKYLNTTGHIIDEGQSAVTNEMCMAVGYQFPATQPTFCVNDHVF